VRWLYHCSSAVCSDKICTQWQAAGRQDTVDVACTRESLAAALARSGAAGDAREVSRMPIASMTVRGCTGHGGGRSHGGNRDYGVPGSVRLDSTTKATTFSRSWMLRCTGVHCRRSPQADLYLSGFSIEKTPLTRAPLRNRTVDLLLTMDIRPLC
jgi:hypothetical protein